MQQIVWGKMDYLASSSGCCNRHNSHWWPGRIAAAAAMLNEVEVTGTVVPGPKDDCNKNKEEEKMGESEDASNYHSYSINNNNKYSNQPQRWW